MIQLHIGGNTKSSSVYLSIATPTCVSFRYVGVYIFTGSGQSIQTIGLYTSLDITLMVTIYSHGMSHSYPGFLLMLLKKC